MKHAYLEVHVKPAWNSQPVRRMCVTGMEPEHCNRLWRGLDQVYDPKTYISSFVRYDYPKEEINTLNKPV